MFDFVSANWALFMFSGVSSYLGVLCALITWGAWLQPWFDKRKYVVYTVDMSLRQDGESVDDFMARVRADNLGKYDVIG